MSGVAFQILLVGAGGFVGSVLRYGLSAAVHRWLPLESLPYGTLAVNVSGCLAIGLLAGWSETRQAIGPELRLFVVVGLLGGFTTFSAFGYQSFELARAGEGMRVLANVAAHLVAGLGSVWLGYALATAR